MTGINRCRPHDKITGTTDALITVSAGGVEIGDFGVLVHGGWSKRKALLFNLLSGSTFLVGGLIAYSVSFAIDVSFLVPFAAGNFLYIGASDLVPELTRHRDLKVGALHFASFVVGVLLLLAVKLLIPT